MLVGVGGWNCRAGAFGGKNRTRLIRRCLPFHTLWELPRARLSTLTPQPCGELARAGKFPATQLGRRVHLPGEGTCWILGPGRGSLQAPAGRERHTLSKGVPRQSGQSACSVLLEAWPHHSQPGGPTPGL